MTFKEDLILKTELAKKGQVINIETELPSKYHDTKDYIKKICYLSADNGNYMVSIPEFIINYIDIASFAYNYDLQHSSYNNISILCWK